MDRTSRDEDTKTITETTAVTTTTGATEAPTKRRRGFAAMDPELRRTIAIRGGQAAHALGRAHRWTSEEARVAGRRGAHALAAKNALVDATREPAAPEDKPKT